MDFIINLPLVWVGNIKQNCIFTVVNFLANLVQIIPCFMGNAALAAPIRIIAWVVSAT